MLDIQKRLTNRFFIILAMPATSMGFALSVQISALSWILSNKYGLDIHDVGLVWAAGPIAGIIGQVVIGLISDNVWFWNGRRRPFILIGGVLAALMILSLPNIDVISSAMGIDGILGIAITVALILDLAINVSFNPCRAIIADVTPEGVNRTKGYTWMQTISGSLSVGAYGIGAYWDNYVLLYSGAVIVFLTSFIPTFFIEEPKELTESSGDEQVPVEKTSFREVIMSIQPLWGFLLYAVYALTIRLGHIEVDNYYAEIILGVVTVLLIGNALMTSEEGKPKEVADGIGFKKVLAAHSFSWIGVQTMFVYTVFFVAQKFPDIGEINHGRIVSMSFLVLNAIGALLPAFVLEPITEKIGRVKTHAICIAVMAAGYAGILFFTFAPAMMYVWMAVVGVGWAAVVSLPFAIMSQKVSQTKMGLYMGLFNLSVVLPQLVASLGVGAAVSKAENKGLIFIICALTLAVSSLSWFLVKENEGEAGEIPMSGGGH